MMEKWRVLLGARIHLWFFFLFCLLFLFFSFSFFFFFGGWGGGGNFLFYSDSILSKIVVARLPVWHTVALFLVKIKWVVTTQIELPINCQLTAFSWTCCLAIESFWRCLVIQLNLTEVNLRITIELRTLLGQGPSDLTISTRLSTNTTFQI